MKEKQKEWSPQKMEDQEASLKGKQKNLNPLHEEEAYLLLVALLLIASGPAGIVLSAGLIASYGGIKAFQLKQFIDKAKKIKDQRILQEQNLLKSDTPDKKEELTEEQKTNEGLKIDRTVGEDLTSKSESREDQGADEDLSEILSHLDSELLDKIHNMSDTEIYDLKNELSQSENTKEITERLLSLKKNVNEITTSSNTLNPETQEQAKNLNAKLNKLINQSIGEKVEVSPSVPGRIKLKREDVDITPNGVTSQTESQGAGLFPPGPLHRHDNSLLSSRSNHTDLNDDIRSLGIARGGELPDFSRFSTPLNELTPQGRQNRSNQLEKRHSAPTKKVQPTKEVQPTKARRKSF